MIQISLSLGVLILMLLPQYLTFNFTTITEESSALTECIVKIVENLPGEVLKITVLAEEEHDGIVTTLLKQVNTPVIVNAFEYTKRRGIYNRVFNDLVIIIMDNYNVQNVRRILWNGSTKFLVVLPPEKSAEDVFKQFWNRKMINVFALQEDTEGLSLYSFLPLQMDDCDNTKPILIDRWNGTTFPNSGFPQLREEIRIRKAHGCPVNVSVVDIKPSVIFPKDCNCSVSRDVDGLEARVLKVIVEKFNFSAVYKAPTDGREWGEARPPKGIIGEVYTGRSDFAFGLIVPFPERYEQLDLSQPYGGDECVTFVLPSHFGSKSYHWWTIVSADLSVVVLVLIFLSFFTVTVVFFSIGSSSPTDSLMCVIASFLGQSVHVPEKLGLKFLIVFWIFFNMFIGNVYQVSLGREITVPTRPPEIRTFRELFETNLKLLGHRKTVHSLKMSADDPIYMELVQRLSPANFTVKTAIDHLVKDRNIAFLQQMSVFSYVILSNRIADRKLRRLRQCIVSYKPVIALTKNSPYTKRANDIILRIFESGMSNHWRSFFVYRIPDRVTNGRPVQLGQSLGIFYVLVTGLALAFVVFIFEVIFYEIKFFKKYDSRKRKAK